MAEDRTRCERFRDWVGSPTSYIYFNYFLSSWGDRMWHFAVALYLVYLADESLRLAAIFGFTSAFAVLLFGGIIGNWVDNNGRLKVVRISLFLQNMLVAICAVMICVLLLFQDEVSEMWNGGMMMLAEAAIVVVAVLAQLASVAYKIAIEKDWIVVIAGQDGSKLANLNATSRSIDLSCKLLAPTATGLIMASSSLKVSAMVIAGWNIVSVFIEYGLLSKVYRLVPRLAVKEDPEEESEENEIECQKEVEMLDIMEDEKGESSLPLANGDESKAKPEISTPLNDDTEKYTETDTLEKKGKKKKKKEKKSCFQVVFEPFLVLTGGWKTYANQKVVFAGISLSFLYMTVMGFDSVTLGYIYAQGVSELVVGFAMALAGLTGIMGTFLFTRVRKMVGLERTGLFAFSIEIGLLSLSVASIFLPGSPFAPHIGYKDITCSINSTNSNSAPMVSVAVTTAFTPAANENGNAGNDTEALNRFVRNIYVEGDSFQENRQTWLDAPPMLDSMAAFPGYVSRQLTRSKREASSGDAEVENPDASERLLEDERKKSCYHYDGVNISIILFITGIVASRIGLWMADLVVTQLLQENVVERERGVVNGVQNSLNMLMDLLKFTLVIVVPQIHLFGFLIIASFIFICAAGCLFAFHSYRVRGHLFHFNRIFGFPCCTDYDPKAAQVNTKDQPIYKPPKTDPCNV